MWQGSRNLSTHATGAESSEASPCSPTVAAPSLPQWPVVEATLAAAATTPCPPARAGVSAAGCTRRPHPLHSEWFQCRLPKKFVASGQPVRPQRVQVPLQCLRVYLQPWLPLQNLTNATTILSMLPKIVCATESRQRMSSRCCNDPCTSRMCKVDGQAQTWPLALASVPAPCRPSQSYNAKTHTPRGGFLPGPNCCPHAFGLLDSL